MRAPGLPGVGRDGPVAPPYGVFAKQLAHPKFAFLLGALRGCCASMASVCTPERLRLWGPSAALVACRCGHEHVLHWLHSRGALAGADGAAMLRQAVAGLAF